MSTELTQIFPQSVKVVIKGTEYSLTPLSLDSIAKLENYVRYAPYFAMVELDAPQDQCQKVFNHCVSTPASMLDVDKSLHSLNGSLEAIYLALKPKHPDITRDWLRSNAQDDAKGLFEAFKALSQGKQDEKKVDN